MVKLEAPEAETSCLLVPQYGLSSKNASSYISHNATILILKIFAASEKLFLSNSIAPICGGGFLLQMWA